MSHLYHIYKQVIDNRYADACIIPNSSANAKKMMTQKINAEGLVFNMV